MSWTTKQPEEQGLYWIMLDGRGPIVGQLWSVDTTDQTEVAWGVSIVAEFQGDEQGLMTEEVT